MIAETAEEARRSKRLCQRTTRIFKWYIIHAYSGVRAQGEGIARESRVAAYQPGRPRWPHRDSAPSPQPSCAMARKYTIDRVFLPGYVFVEMALDNEMWHVDKEHATRHRLSCSTGDSQLNRTFRAGSQPAMLNRADVTKEKPKRSSSSSPRASRFELPKARSPTSTVHGRRRERRQADPEGDGQHFRALDTGRNRVFEGRQDGAVDLRLSGRARRPCRGFSERYVDCRRTIRLARSVKRI